MRRTSFRFPKLTFTVSLFALLSSGLVWAQAEKEGARVKAQENERVLVLRKLAESRSASALLCYAQACRLVLGGERDHELAYTWSKTALSAHLDISSDPANRLSAYQAHQSRMTKLTVDLKRDHQGDDVPRSYWEQLDYYVEEANFWVAREAR